MLTKKSLENINVEKLGLSFFDKSRVMYIKDEAYTPKLDRIAQGCLDLVFSNRNLENVLI
jgi:hypothetical protein